MSNGLLPSTERALNRRIAVEQAQSRVPSIVAGLVRNGTTVWTGRRGSVVDTVDAGGLGPTADTQYRIGSITKTFVAVLVMRLRDAGKLDLADPLDEHLPGTPFGDRRIGELLAHTGGLTAESPGSWWERAPGGDWSKLAAQLGPAQVKHRAARRFHYSNLGYGVLGELVSRLRGMSWLDAVRAEILDPLGLARTTPMPMAPHATGWAVHPAADVLLPEPTPDAGAMAPAGQLWSTVTDLARWTAFLGGDTGEVVHPDTVAEMREPSIVDDGDTWVGGQGLGLQLFRQRGRRLAGHTGSMPGFLATALTDPIEGSGALVLANSTAGVNIVEVVLDLLDLLAEHEPAMPTEWTPLTGADQRTLALTGSWYWGPSVYTLRLLADDWVELAPATGRGRASRFRPDGAERWVGLDGYYAEETLRVVRRTDGTVSHLDLNTFIFTRAPYDPAADIPGGVDPAGWRGRTER